MASTDWSTLTDGIDAASMVRGVTAGLTPPAGGGSYVHAFNTVVGGISGAAGRKYTGVNFDPMANGGRITGAVVKLASGGNTGFAPMLFMSLQGNSVNDTGYLLGLQDDDPSYIVLRKGTLVSGIPAGSADPLVNGLLRVSTDPVDVGTWVHLRLTVEVGGTGDVTLTVEQNDLSANDVTAPVWSAIPGMDEFIDDSAQINTGSAPLVGGRAGFAFWANDITRRCAFDHITVARQQ